MATKTPNYGLTKPAGSDYYNVEDFNDNADLIDAALKKLDDEKANLDKGGKVPAEQIPEHTHAAGNIAAGTFKDTGVKAKDGTDYSVARVRNIMASDADLTAGSSPLPSGTIYIVFE